MFFTFFELYKWYQIAQTITMTCLHEGGTIKIKCQLQTIVFYTIEPLKILKGISGANKVGNDLSKNLFHFIPQKVQNNF